MASASIRYYVLLVLAMAFWGGSWVSAKVVVAIAPPLTVGFFRFLIASLLFIPTIVLTQQQSMREWSRREWGIFFVLGFSGIFGYGVLFLFAMQFTTSAQGAIIAGINPTSVSLFAHIIHKERLGQRWQYSGFVLSFLGVIFVVGIQSFLEFHFEYLIGNGILICAMMIWGLYSNLGKTAMQTRSSLEVTWGGILFGTTLFGLGAGLEQFWTLPVMTDLVFWVNVFYMGIFVTFFGFLFYFTGIKNLGATQSATFISLVPIFGTMFSVLFLQEAIYWTFIVGLVLVVMGILVINYPQTTNTY